MTGELGASVSGSLNHTAPTTNKKESPPHQKSYACDRIVTHVSTNRSGPDSKDTPEIFMVHVQYYFEITFKMKGVMTNIRILEVKKVFVVVFN